MAGWMTGMPVPTTSPRPTASTRRLSSMREAMSCRPLRVRHVARHSSSAPITGAGSSSQALDELGHQRRQQQQGGGPVAQVAAGAARGGGQAHGAAAGGQRQAALTSAANRCATPSVCTPRASGRRCGRTQSASAPGCTMVLRAHGGERQCKPGHRIRHDGPGLEAPAKRWQLRQAQPGQRLPGLYLLGQQAQQQAQGHAHQQPGQRRQQLRAALGPDVAAHHGGQCQGARQQRGT